MARAFLIFSETTSFANWIFVGCTCSDVYVPGLDLSERVLRDASVGLGVHLLRVVLGPEGGQHQIAVVQHLQIKVN